MTGLSPSALPAAVSTAGPSGLAACPAAIQEAGFASVFGEHSAFASRPGTEAGLPTSAEAELPEIDITGTLLSEFAQADGTVPEVAGWPESAIVPEPADTLVKGSPPAQVLTDHAANLMRIRLDLTQEASATRAEGAQSGRNRAAGQSDTVEMDKPVPGVTAAAPAPQGFDAAFGAVDPPSAGDVQLTETGAEGGDPTGTHATQEARRGGSESVLLHRTANAPPPAERQILAAISATPSGRTEILLDPQDLGRVRLSLEGDESALVLTIQAERGDTADLLRRNADLLLQEFRQAGYQNLTFSFTDQGHAAADQQSAGADIGLDDADLTAELVADLSSPRTALGSLDLRL